MRGVINNEEYTPEGALPYSLVDSIPGVSPSLFTCEHPHHSEQLSAEAIDLHHHNPSESLFGLVHPGLSMTGTTGWVGSTSTYQRHQIFSLGGYLVPIPRSHKAKQEAQTT